MKDDRGQLDLTRRIDELEEALDGYVQLVVMQKNEIWGLKQIQSCLLYTSPSPRD